MKGLGQSLLLRHLRLRNGALARRLGQYEQIAMQAATFAARLLVFGMLRLSKGCRPRWRELNRGAGIN